MAQTHVAVVQGKRLSCPVCGHDAAVPKKYLAAGRWAQMLDFEWAGEKAVMVICAQCSFIRHFADESAVDFVEA